MKDLKIEQVESIVVNGVSYPKYNLGDKETEGKVFLLAVKMTRIERPYIDKKTGEKKIAVSLAEIGSNFGGENLGTINLRVLITPTRSVNAVKAVFNC
jgi:hypothetical protein